MNRESINANQLYELKVDRAKKSSFLMMLFRPIGSLQSEVGRAGVAVIRKRDGKIVAIINDDSWDSVDVRTQMDADLETMSAFDFEQTYGVNIAR